jgi:rubrerythrin
MNLQEAIGVALDFERKVRDHYHRGAKAIEDAEGRRLFQALAVEEQGHVEYLEYCLAEWKKTGVIPRRALKTTLPRGVKWIEDERKKLLGRPDRRVASATEVEALKLALQHEKDADAFYHRLVTQLPREEQALFEPFLGIEDGHVALVQAELDSVLGTGFWFDVMEFRLETE